MKTTYNQAFPDNTYENKCSCGTEFLAPKGNLYCHHCLYKQIKTLENNQAIRDLEQQAKGIEDAIESKSFNKVYYISGLSKVENICTTEDLIVQAEQLHKQARELK